MEQRLNNHIAYYEAIAAGRKDVDTFGYATWGRTPSIEQRAEMIAEEQRKYLAHPVDRHGNRVGVSSAVFQFRADVAALKICKGKMLGELAAIGRADVMQEDFINLLKMVKKLKPTQKARKDAGCKGDYYDAMFDHVTLHFSRPSAYSFGTLAIEMRVIDESGEVTRISVAKAITARIKTANFSVSVDFDTLFELIKTYDKERLSIQYHDWISRVAVQQKRNTARLIAHEIVGGVR